MKRKILALLLSATILIGNGVLAYAEAPYDNEVVDYNIEIQNEEGILSEENEAGESQEPQEPQGPQEPQAYEAPELEESDFALGLGQVKQIAVPSLIFSSTVDPNTGEIINEYIAPTCSFRIADEQIAQVSAEGIVSALAVGRTILTVEYSYVKDEQILCSRIAYLNVDVTDISLSADNFLLNIYGIKKSSSKTYETGDYVTLVGYSEYSTVEIVTSSPDMEIKQRGADLYFTPKKVGQYSVSIIADGKALACNVTVLDLGYSYNSKSVTDVKAKKWEQGSTMLALYTGETTTLKAKGFSEGANIVWSSSNKSVATVSKTGEVKAKSIGYTTISASAAGYTITYEVGVANKTSIKAMRYAVKHFNSTYSQPKRMSTGYYDCSSYVWRAYKDAGFNIGNCKTGWAPVAASLAQWCVTNKYMVYSGTVKVDNLLPGDLIFWTGENNGRYQGIYHVDMYVGNHRSLTVAREKAFGDVISNCMVARPNSGTKISKITLSQTKANGKKAIKVSWSGCYNATGYNVYRSTSKYGKYKKIASVKDAKTYVDSSAKAGTTYYYKVRPYWKAYSKAYAGKFSDIKSKKLKK